MFSSAALYELIFYQYIVRDREIQLRNKRSFKLKSVLTTKMQIRRGWAIGGVFSLEWPRPPFATPDLCMQQTY